MTPHVLWHLVIIAYEKDYAQRVYYAVEGHGPLEQTSKDYFVAERRKPRRDYNTWRRKNNNSGKISLL